MDVFAHALGRRLYGGWWVEVYRDGWNARGERKGRDPFNLGGSKRRGALRRHGTGRADARVIAPRVRAEGA